MSDLRTVYISGPMRGIPGFNFPEFDTAADRASHLGFDPITPAEMDRQNEGLVTEEQANTPAMLEKYLRRDAHALITADAIAMLPGWENSVGAKMELAIALFLKRPVLDAYNFLPLSVTLTGRTYADVIDHGCRTGMCGMPKAPSYVEVIAQQIANGEKL